MNINVNEFDLILIEVYINIFRLVSYILLLYISEFRDWMIWLCKCLRFWFIDGVIYCRDSGIDFVVFDVDLDWSIFIFEDWELL